MCLGAQSPGHDTFLRSRRVAGLIPTHQANTDVVLLVGLYPHWSLNNGRCRCAMLLLPQNDALNLFKQRSFAACQRLLPGRAWDNRQYACDLPGQAWDNRQYACDLPEALGQ